MLQAIAGLVLVLSPAAQAREPNSAHIIEADQIVYAPIDTALGPAHVAFLFGHPRAAGPYLMRLKFPAEATIPPHYHNDSLKIVTLLEGILWFAYGQQFEQGRLRQLKPGAAWTESKGQYHYGQTGPNGATIEIYGIGPVSTHFPATTGAR